MNISNKTMPHCLILISGKRKSGKDFISDKLHEVLGKETAEIIRISHPIKSHWAKSSGLDLQELLSDGPYKENYRRDMLIWGEAIRKTDYGYFCRAACSTATKQIWIVSDVRRKTDVKWFKENFNNIIFIRIEANDEIREKRGWIYTADIDDGQSECDLDDYIEWDLRINNDGTNNIPSTLVEIQNLCKTKCSLLTM